MIAIEVNKMIKSTDKAYTAGLFDGEGCIHINRWANTLKNGHKYGLLVQIKMCDGRLLHHLHEQFGGNLNLLKRSLDNPKHSDILIWRVECRKAMAFLNIILPYLHLKKKQAELAIKFQLAMPTRSRGRYPVQPEEISFRELCYNQMRDFKSSEKTTRLF